MNPMQSDGAADAATSGERALLPTITWPHKLYYHGCAIFRRLWYKIMLGYIDMPVSFYMETDARCSRNCSYCPVSMAPHKTARIKTETVCALLDALRQWKFIGSMNWGVYNEPTLDDRLPEFIRYDNKRFLARSVVWTNGDSPKVLRACLEAGATAVVSTHGSIERFQSPEWQALFNEFAARISVRVISDTTSGVFLSNRGGIVKTQMLPDQGPCYAALHIIVSSDLSLRLCCNDYDGFAALGQVSETPTRADLESYWNNARWRTIRQGLLQGKRTYPQCRVCSYSTPQPLSVQKFLAEIKS